MSRTAWCRLAVATLLVVAVAATTGAARTDTNTARPAYDRAQLQHDLDAIRDAGVSGVLAEVHVGARVLRGTSGVSDLATGAPVAPNGCDPDAPLDATDMSMTWSDGDGSLVTTAADLSRFWRAIDRGELLPAARTNEMRTTVANPAYVSRYGLGIVWTPLTCGGGYWNHDGGVPGFSTVNGVTDGGRVTVVVSVSSTPASDSASAVAYALIDHVMCGVNR